MNPFQSVSTQSPALLTKPLLIYSSSPSHFLKDTVDHDYAISVQCNPKFIAMRERNYCQMLTSESTSSLPHTAIYKTQHLVDLFLSRVCIDSAWYPLLSRLCLYLVTSYNLCVEDCKTNPSTGSFTSLLRLVEEKYNKSKVWLDYTLCYILSVTGSGITCECPYTISYRLLKQIKFECFESYAQIIIDNVCTRYVSPSLSPHTIAYYSVLVSMRFYYGDCQGYTIVPEQSIPERETSLCLCLIGSLYKFLHPICLNISNSQTPSILEETVQLSSSTYPSSTAEHENVPP